MQGKVTGVEAQKKNTDRVNIYIDYEFSFACSSELVYKYKIQKGNKIEEQNIIEITEEDNYFKGKNDALKCIERTYKSEKEVIDKLLAKEYDEKTINRVMEFMKEQSGAHFDPDVIKIFMENIDGIREIQKIFS